MPKFGKRSRKELATAHPDLQRLFNEVVKMFDCAVICGHRGKADQEKAFAGGFSKVQWPKSKHNQVPARAVDVVPWPSGFKDEEEFYKLAGFVKGIAAQMKINVQWGGDWKKFRDLPHWQIVDK